VTAPYHPSTSAHRTEVLKWMLTAVAASASMAVPIIRQRLSDGIGLRDSYTYGTLVLLVSAIVLIRAWPPPKAGVDPGRAGWWFLRVGGCVLGVASSFVIASTLLPAVFAGPPDVYRADMLPVIEAGVREFLNGRTPYTTFEHISWRPTLPYGPPLWLPFAIPVLGHADVRILTLVGYLAIVVVCGWSALFSAASRCWAASAALGVIALTLAGHRDLHSFFPIAHSPVYWPLLFGLCVLLRAERWVAAAAVLGLLVSTRTPMVSLVPVFLMAAYHRGRLTRGVLAWLVIVAAAPFVPFLLYDAASVLYALYGSYGNTVKKAVWLTPDIFRTYGSTALLLERGLHAYVELVQLAVMVIVYGAAWRGLTARQNPEPWLAFALLVFSLTTLWPVIYLFFDVWVLTASALAVTNLPLETLRPRRMAVYALAIIAIAATGVFTAAVQRPGWFYTIDVGTEAAAPLTGGGFGRDESATEGERSFVWVEGTTARIRVPRVGWRAATVRVAVRPHEPTAGLQQRVTATLNGAAIGTAVLQPAWQEIAFPTQPRSWAFGFNLLDLHFSYALPGPTSDRAFSVAIDLVSIERSPAR
jgi:hypothetical protein